MGMQELKQELQAITPEQMVDAVKSTSWNLGSRYDMFKDEFLALKEEYPGLAAAVELMVAADVTHGRDVGEAWENVASGIWALLALKKLVDTDQLEQIVDL